MLHGQSQRLEIQPKARVRLNDKVHFLHKATPSRLEEVAVHLMQRNQQRESRKMKKQRKNMFQMKE